MVFPSLPVYLDPPTWNQQQQDVQQLGNGIGGGGGGGELHQLPPGQPLPPRSEGGMGGQVRPGSMADRARLAKLPQPEVALKCPRCDSPNTKFCYFNNYSLTQPRHFCKTCRRYWTRGGALRNVPVGGGCRRNKRSKASGSSSKIQASKGSNSGTSSSTSTATTVVGGAITPNITSTPQLPFMASLHHLAEYGTPNLGLNFPGMQPVDAVEFQVGNSSSSGLEQWRFQQIQQFPFFGAVEQVGAPAPPMQGSYPFEGEGGVDTSGFAAQAHMKAYSAGLINQMASVKMEDNPHFLNLQRPYLSVARNDQTLGNSTGVGAGVNGNGNGNGNGSGSGGNSDGGCSTGGGWMMGLSGFNSSSSLL